MLTIFNGLRDVSVASIVLRMVLAVVCGGVIGVEREFKRRPAGFRTHILICIGAAMTTLTGQYLFLVMHYYTDVARLGAQVIAGVGFIGAGTIIVTQRQRVKGLTTAAGLWTAAIVGLSLGTGFYEGGIFTTACVLVAELVFSRWEYRLFQDYPEVNIYMEYDGKPCLDAVLAHFRERNIRILNMEITRSAGSEKHNASVLFSLRLKKFSAGELIGEIKSIPGTVMVEEL